MCCKCYVLVQRKSVQNVQERPGIYTGFVKVNIEISKNVKFILKLQSVFKMTTGCIRLMDFMGGQLILGQELMS